MMDWGRAKNIILAVLVITNIFLIAVYGLRYEHTKENNSELRSYTIDKLTDNRIDLQCDIPDKPGKMPALTVRYEKYDKSEIEKIIYETQTSAEESGYIKPESRQEYEAAAAAFLDDCGLLSKGAVPAEFTEEGGKAVVHFENRYDGIPLEECYMDVTFQDGVVADLKRQWVEPVEEGSAKLSITEPVTALLGFIDLINEERMGSDSSNSATEDKTSGIAEEGGSLSEQEVSETEKGQNTVTGDQRVNVESIRLVYYVDKDSVGGNILYDTAFPAWRIKYNGGGIKYISAFEQ